MVASKSDAIAAIMEMNPTANPIFLSEFSKSDLEQYLDRLGRVIDTEHHHDRLTNDFPASPSDSTQDTASSNESWW